MSVAFTFDGKQFDPTTFGGGAETVLDAGKYLMQITGSERKPVGGDATGTKSFLAIECVVASDGPFKGVKKTLRFNLWNDNQDAVRIGAAELSALSHVVGIPQWQATGQLHGKYFGVEFDKVPNTYTNRAGVKQEGYQNNARAYYDQQGRTVKEVLAGLGGGPAPGAPAAQAAPAATPQPANGFGGPAAAAGPAAPVPSAFGPTPATPAAGAAAFGPSAGAAPAGFGGAAPSGFGAAPAADAPPAGGQPQWR